MGYAPFVFPAMGSHGSATAAGHTEMLAELGVTELAIGCEIRSTKSAIEVGRTPERDVPVVAHAEVVAADAIVPINRIRSHTDFDGTVERGSRRCSSSEWRISAVRRSSTTGRSTERSVR